MEDGEEAVPCAFVVQRWESGGVQNGPVMQVVLVNSFVHFSLRSVDRVHRLILVDNKNNYDHLAMGMPTYRYI